MIKDFDKMEKEQLVEILTETITALQAVYAASSMVRLRYTNGGNVPEQTMETLNYVLGTIKDCIFPQVLEK